MVCRQEKCATNGNKNVKVGNGHVIQETPVQGDEKNVGSGVRERGDEMSEAKMIK